MELLLLVWRQYRWPFISVMALSLVSAALGIGLIAFINQRLIETVDTTLMVLPDRRVAGRHRDIKSFCDGGSVTNQHSITLDY